MRRRLLALSALLPAGIALACSPDSSIDTSGSSNDTGGAGGEVSTGGAAASGNAGGSTLVGGGGGGNAECTLDTDCDPGSICDETGTCVPGCSAEQPCGLGLTCCEGTCVDTATDVENCGECGTVCPAPPNIEVTCSSVCGLAGCDAGYYNCDGDASNGCEQTMPCSCTPGEVQSCYDGPPNTQGVGTCVAGTQMCNAAGTAWSLCDNQVMPLEEVCANGLDDDCNGVVDDSNDADNDGWTKCDGDCCDVPGVNCADPGLVNPGAFEFVGNMVDDDCDPGTPDNIAAPACSTAAKLSGVTPVDVAQAIDLCQFTTLNPPLAQRKWGVVSAEFRLANGAAPNATQLSNMQSWQAAVLQNYGTGGVVPQKGGTMAGISSGRMRDQNDSGYVNPNSGTNFGSSSTPPAVYLAAHGNQLPSSAGCSGSCPSGSGANDSINVRLTIRVPTNAQSFSYNFRFFSSEYWTYSCTAFNDFYLALLTTLAPGIPADKNISFDSLNNPVSVNNGFFDSCVPKGCYTCPLGTGPLNGTGMQLSSTGGGTSWLVTTAPIVPGEDMVLELMVFDVSDGILDSLSILDDFEWSVTPSMVGTNPG